MEPTDVTLEVLRSIRDEVRGVGTRLDHTNERLDQTNERLDRLERRQAETEIRVSTQLVAVVGAVHELRDVLREDRALRGQVQDLDSRVRRLEAGR